jgi:hypothetical protein
LVQLARASLIKYIQPAFFVAAVDNLIVVWQIDAVSLNNYNNNVID